MRNRFSFSVLCILCWLSAASQQAFNMGQIYRYDDSSLPSRFGISYNDVWGYVSSDGKEIAIVGTIDSILFFDVSNPAQIVKLPGIAPGSRSIWRDFKVYRNFCYATADQGSEGLTIVNMDSLLAGHVSYKTIDSTFVTAHNLWIDTPRAKMYIAGANINSAKRGLIVYDLQSDPWNPSVSSIFNFNQQGYSCGTGSTNTYVHDLHVINDTAYTNKNNECGFFISNMSDPANPEYLGDLPPSGFGNGYNHSCWVNKDRTIAVVAEETLGKPIYLVDISDPGNLSVVGTYKDPLLQGQTRNIAHNPFILGDLCFISYYEDGVIVIDISDPTSPFRVAHFDTEPANTSYNGFDGCWGVYPYLPSGNILATDVQNGFFLLKMAPSLLAEEELSFSARLTPSQMLHLNATLKTDKTIQAAWFEWSLDGRTFTPFHSIIPTEGEGGMTKAISANHITNRPSQQAFFVRMAWQSPIEINYSTVKFFNAHGTNHWIYPNPIQHQFFVHSPSNTMQLQFINPIGQKVYHTSTIAGYHPYQLPDHLPAGRYQAVLLKANGKIFRATPVIVP